MTKLEDQISSAQTLRYVTVVMFAIAEVLSLTHAVTYNHFSPSPFGFLAYGMTAVMAGPYLISRQGLKLLGKLEDRVSDSAARAALSQQISKGANMAYAVLFFIFGMFDLTTGWRDITKAWHG